MYRLFFILLLLSPYLFSTTFITVTYPIERFFIKKIADNTIYIKTIHSGNNFDKNDNSEVKKLANSDYYFNFNLDDEVKISSLLKQRNSRIKIFNMLQGIPYLKLNNGKVNPYIWLDPIIVRDLVQRVYEKLVELEPENIDIYKINYENFLVELDEIYLDIKQRVEVSRTFGFFAFNNDLDYFAKRFGLNIYHREYKLLHISEISDLLKLSRKENIKHILIPKNSDYRVAQSFSGHIGGKIVEYNIFSYDWKVNLYSLLRGIESL